MRRLSIPALATSMAIVLLYTNLPVVLARGGMIPSAVAVVVPLLFLMATIHQLVIRRLPLVVDRTLLVMLAFLGVLLISTFWAAGPQVAFRRIGSFVSEGFLMYLLVRNGVRTFAELRVAMVAVLLAASLLAGLTFVQSVTGNYEQNFFGLAERRLEHLEGQPAAVAAGTGDEDRARGPVDEPNRFAQILLMAAPLALVFGLNARRRGTALLAVATLGLVLGGVLLTYSRGAFVTLLALCFIAVPLRLIRPGRLAAALAACALIAPFVAPGYVERIVSIAGAADLMGGSSQVEADGPTKGRTTEMLAALAAYVDHPVVGVGPGQYEPYHSVAYQKLPEISIRELAVPRRAHNLYLEMAAETGTVGLLIFLAIPLLLLRDLEALRRRLFSFAPDRARWAAGFALVLLSYLGTGVFLHLSFERYYWFFIALAAAAIPILGTAPGGADISDGRGARARPYHPGYGASVC